eukprot:2113293-Pyramimonas_sp.AAC.1
MLAVVGTVIPDGLLDMLSLPDRHCCFARACPMRGRRSSQATSTSSPYLLAIRTAAPAQVTRDDGRPV